MKHALSLFRLLLVLSFSSAACGYTAQAALLPPLFNRATGPVPTGFAFSLSHSNTSGAILFTTDGTDPRTPVGTVNRYAQAFSREVTVNRTTTVTARVRSGTNWSDLVQATFSTAHDYTKLLITELAYQPPGATPAQERSREFVELKNVGTETLDLSGINFRGYVFPTNSSIGPGGFKVLVRDTNAFLADHPGALVSGGPFSRLLNDDSETSLLHASGSVLFYMAYKTHGPWPTLPDDHNFTDKGFPLVAADPNTVPDPSSYHSWRTSMVEGGSPGMDDPPETRPQILVTEVLARPGSGGYPVEAVELFNPYSTNVNISGWFLSDSRHQPKGFQLPSGTIVPAGGYLVLDADDFQVGTTNDIAFNSAGEYVYLFSATPAGKLTGYGHGFGFSGSERGVTYGRHVNSVGDEYFVPQASQSLGASNSGPLLGPVVVTEFMYNPPPGELMFVEFMNVTDAPVPLYDPANPQNTWLVQFSASFSFPSNAVIPPRSSFLVVEGSPETFRTRYAVPTAVPIFGPLERFPTFFNFPLYLEKPSGLVIDPITGPVPRHLPVDVIDFKRQFPWPAGANGSGFSLERIALDVFGSDPANWRESPTGSSPGRLNSGNLPPKVALLSPRFGVAGTAMPLAAYVEDDGLPRSPGTVTSLWTRVSGPGTSVISNAGSSSTTIYFNSPGTNILNFTAGDGTTQSVLQATLVILSSPYAAWQANHFSNDELANPFLSGAAADPDSDGLSNIAEYFHGLHPRQPDPAPLKSEVKDGRITVTFPRSASATDLTFTPEAANSVTGPWITNGLETTISPSTVNSAHQTVTIQDTSGSHPSRFVRMRISRAN